MRVVFCTVKNVLRGGGIEKYTLELGSRLVARGHQVQVYSMTHYGSVPSSVNGMSIIPVPTVRSRALEKILSGLVAGVRAMGQPKGSVVHFHATVAGLFAFMARLRGLPTVLQLHGVDWQRSRWSPAVSLALRAIEWGAVRQPHALTAVSEAQCRFYEERYGVGDVTYIPTGSDIKPHVEAEEILSWGLVPHRYVLFVARLVREKGAHFLIDAFQRQDSDWRLVIAGDAKGEDAYKEELMGHAAGDPRIIFPGFVEGTALDELFSNAGVYVQPSEVEGLSIALLEAMSYGLICLVSDIPENLEALGGCGVTFKSKSVDDLSQRLRDLIQGGGSGRELAEQARERVRKHYSWDVIADRFEELYASLLS